MIEDEVKLWMSLSAKVASSKSQQTVRIQEPNQAWITLLWS